MYFEQSFVLFHCKCFLLPCGLSSYFVLYHTEVFYFNVAKLLIIPLCFGGFCLYKKSFSIPFSEILLVFSKFYSLTFNLLGIKFLYMVWGKNLFFSCSVRSASYLQLKMVSLPQWFVLPPVNYQIQIWEHVIGLFDYFNSLIM